MNEMFSQGGKGSTGILTNKQAVARHFGVKQSEVIYFSAGALLSGYKVIYDKVSQRAYSLPADLGSGVTATSLSAAGVLVHSAGNVDLGALAVTREEYVTLPGSFDSGVTVNTKNELVTFTDGKYRWNGTLPKDVPADSTPATTGGVGEGAWVNVGVSALRNELASIIGPNAIGGATYTSLRKYSGSASAIYVIGRSNIFDGANGWFDKVLTPDLTDDDGIVLISENGDKWLRRDRANVNVLWFGADPSGSSDSAVSINAAFSAARATNNGRTGLPPVATVPAGTYTINGMVEVFDWANGTIMFEGAYFSGTGASNLDAVLQINNASNLKLTGSLTITTNGLSNYSSAFSIKASPGGLIKPDTGIVSHVDIFGLTARESYTAISIGEVDSDAQVAEINFHGCETMFCAVGVHIKGSQTGASFNGCTLTSGVWSTFPSETKYRTLLMDGGICEINGGEFVNSGVPKNSISIAGIEMRPCVSTTYSNTYGALRISGTLIELNSSLLIVGPGTVTGPYKSDTSFCSISNCGGYVDQISGGNFVEIFDTTYSGTVTIDDSCNFYSIAGSRTGKNIKSDSNLVRINVGRTSFGTGFMDWMGGVSGGVLKHPMLPVAAANTTTQGLSASVDNVIKLDNEIGTGGFARYAIYSSSTSRITVPTGCRSFRIEYLGRGGGLTGNVRIRKNGTQTVVYGIVASGVISVNLTEGVPVPGDYYEIVLVPDSGGTGLTESRLIVLAEF